MWEFNIFQLIVDCYLYLARTELDSLKEHFPAYDIDRAIVEKLRKHHE